MAAKHEITERRDAMQEVADNMIALIEKGGLPPWKREWNPNKCVGPQAPMNPVTHHAYRGINVLILGTSLLALTTANPWWCTYKQAAEKGWQVKKGSRATTIFFTKPPNVKDEEAEEGERTIRILKHYPVFHASQIEGIPAYTPPTVEEAPWTRPESVQLILENCGCRLATGGEKAFYSPSADLIQLPPDLAFSSPAYFSSTAVHEVNHSTGHSSRMNRDLSGKYGSEKYAMEEARVDMAAEFVCNTLNLPTDYVNHASYIGNWLKKIREDRRELFKCAADAQRIADWTLGYHPDYLPKSVLSLPDCPNDQKMESQAAASL